MVESLTSGWRASLKNVFAYVPYCRFKGRLILVSEN